MPASKKRPTDIPSQNVLHALLRVPSLDDQPLVTVHTSTRSQLGEQELHDVLGLAVHALADLGQVGEHGLFGAFSVDLRRRDGELFAVTSELGIVGVKELVESVKKLLCRGDQLLVQRRGNTARARLRIHLGVQVVSISSHPCFITSRTTLCTSAAGRHGEGVLAEIAVGFNGLATVTGNLFVVITDLSVAEGQSQTW